MLHVVYFEPHPSPPKNQSSLQDYHFPGHSRTKLISHNFPCPGKSRNKFQDFPYNMGTLKNFLTT